jgi:hypothetical protein
LTEVGSIPRRDTSRDRQTLTRSRTGPWRRGELEAPAIRRAERHGSTS